MQNSRQETFRHILIFLHARSQRYHHPIRLQLLLQNILPYAKCFCLSVEVLSTGQSLLMILQGAGDFVQIKV